MKNQPFTTIYIDAFAGTGYRETKEEMTAADQLVLNLCPELKEEELGQFAEGSARIALKINPPFHRYVFIEKDKKRCRELENLKQEFSSLHTSIEIRNEEANECLIGLCSTTNWKRSRAVLFLDPFGMQVEWKTIEAVARTNAIDMWYLFPIGVAVNRLLRRDGRIPEPHYYREISRLCNH